MSEILLSIVTISFNSEKTIRETIESVLKQNYPFFEYIIIDGGSTDRTCEIIEEYIKDGTGNISYLSEDDGGIYDAMNKGLSICKGDVIGIINSDDYYADGVFEEVGSVYKRFSADVIYGDMYKIHGFDLTDHKYMVSDIGNIKKRMSINHPSTFISRACYKKNGKYNLNYNIAADYDFILKLFLSGSCFVKIDKPLSYFRIGGASTFNPKSIVEKYDIHKQNFGNLHASWYLLINTFVFYVRKNISLVKILCRSLSVRK